MRRFAFPVDAKTLVIRPEPETQFEVLSTENPSEVQVVVAQSSSLPPLEGPTVEALKFYFQWNEQESFWWRTLYPATFRTESISPGIEVGYLNEPGTVIPIPGVPRHRPTVDWLFAVQRKPAKYNECLRDPWGPELIRTQDHTPIQFYQSRGLQTYLARFPAAGSEAVWLRLLRGTTAQRPAHRRAFAAEIALLLGLEATDPRAAATLLHFGNLQVEGYEGPYAAIRPPIGVEFQALVADSSPLWPSGPKLRIFDIASALLRTLSAAHTLDPPMTVGVLVPQSLRFYPVGGPHRPLVGTTIIGAPGASEQGAKIPRVVLEIMPNGAPAWLGRQFENSYVASVERDLRALGLCLGELVRFARLDNSSLAAFGEALSVGKYDNAPDALGELQRQVSTQ